MEAVGRRWPRRCRRWRRCSCSCRWLAAAIRYAFDLRAGGSAPCRRAHPAPARCGSRRGAAVDEPRRRGPAAALGAARAGRRAADRRRAGALCRQRAESIELHGALRRVRRSPPYAVVAAGLAALQGTKHGGACERAEGCCARRGDARGARAAVVARLRRGESIPGFGHPLYPAGDPRAAFLLDLIRQRRARVARRRGRVRAGRRRTRGDERAADGGFRGRHPVPRARPAAGSPLLAARRRPRRRLDRARPRTIRRRPRNSPARTLRRRSATGIVSLPFARPPSQLGRAPLVGAVFETRRNLRHINTFEVIANTAPTERRPPHSGKGRHRSVGQSRPSPKGGRDWYWQDSSALR